MNNTKALSAVVLIIFAVLSLVYSLYYLKYWNKQSSQHNGLHLAGIIAFILLIVWGVMLYNDSKKEGYCGNVGANAPQQIIRDGNYTFYSYGEGAPLVNMTGQLGI